MIREFDSEGMFDYFALEGVQLIDLSCFDVFSQIIKIGINATCLVSYFEGDLLGVVGRGQGVDDLEAQDQGSPEVGSQI